MTPRPPRPMLTRPLGVSRLASTVRTAAVLAVLAGPAVLAAVANAAGW